MTLDEILNSMLTEGNLEQILMYFPLVIIGFSILIMLLLYIKNNSKTVQSFLSEFRVKSKLQLRRLYYRIKKQNITKKKENKYEREINKILKYKDPTQAMDELLLMINQYFAEMMAMDYIFTYEEIISKLEKQRKTHLKKFFEKLSNITFSKDEISKKELKTIAEEFLSIVKKRIERERQRRSKFAPFFKYIRKFNQFRKELRKAIRSKESWEEKVNIAIQLSLMKIWKSIWTPIKNTFTPTKVPKKVSFENILKEVKEKKKETKLFDDERPTVEGLFYFLYLMLRKRLHEKKRIDEIYNKILKGQEILAKKKYVIRAEEIYKSIIPLYNSLSEKNKKTILPKIIGFYENIKDCIKFQKAMKDLLYLKKAIRSKKKENIQRLYKEVSKIYQELPQDYKSEIYEHYLEISQELNGEKKEEIKNKPKKQGGEEENATTNTNKI